MSHTVRSFSLDYCRLPQPAFSRTRKQVSIYRAVKRRSIACLPLLALAAMLSIALAEVPSVINFQGRLLVGTNAFDGMGQFKLALQNATGSQVYWRNSPDRNNDGQPDSSVSVIVNRGIYSIAIGDSSLANMAMLPPEVFQTNALYLRVWFNDGVKGFQRLTPDQRITSVAYAIVANTVADGAITPAKLNPALMDQITALSNRVNALTRSGVTLVSSDPRDPDLLSEGFLPFSSVPAPPWAPGASMDSPSPRSGHTAVWTGEEMIVWGGSIGPGVYSSDGGIYRPGQDAWTVVSPINAPAGRVGHSAVWSGEELIVWGGFALSGFRNDGARFNPALQQWTPIAQTGAPPAREGHVTAWTGNRLVVWGGRDSASVLADGAVYNPVTDQWTALNLGNAPSARARATAVWTGNRSIVWGGAGTSGTLGDGAQLIFDASGAPVEWRALDSIGSPAPRTGHTAVWTGEKMIVWGGQSGGAFLNDGAAFDPIANKWEPLQTENAPGTRSGHLAVWTGEEMIVFGGDTESGVTASASAYNPATQQWRVLTNNGNPMARAAASVVWSGTELLVFGGRSGGQIVAALQRLNPQPTWYFFRKSPSANNRE